MSRTKIYVKEFKTAQALEDWLNNSIDFTELMATGEGHTIDQSGVKDNVYFATGNEIADK